LAHGRTNLVFKTQRSASTLFTTASMYLACFLWVSQDINTLIATKAFLQFLIKNCRLLNSSKMLIHLKYGTFLLTVF